MDDSTEDATSPCSACGKGAMFGPLRLYPETGMGGGDVLVSTLPSRLLSAPRTSGLSARVCRTCGHVALTAIEPERLFDYWSAERERRS